VGCDAFLLDAELALPWPRLEASGMVMPAPPAGSQLRSRGFVARAARGGGEYDVSDADVEAFYAETISGSGGDAPKATITAELIVRLFHGEFTSKGYVHYSGLWKGPPPGAIGKWDIKAGMEKLKAFFQSNLTQLSLPRVGLAMQSMKHRKLKIMATATSG